jgi:hypothetical protein
MSKPTPFEILALAWESGAIVADLFLPTATWIIDGDSLYGDEIPLAVRASRAARPRTRILVRRAFHDSVESDWWAAEWTFRSSEDGVVWQEIEQGLLMHVKQGRIAYLRTHNDHGSVRNVQPGDPLREEAWPQHMPAQRRQMTRDEIVATHSRHVMLGWCQGNDGIVVSCHGDTGLIQTPFEIVRGHTDLRRAVRTYHENYADTAIDIHRIVHDGDLVAINQTWSCTNRKTGLRAGDEDLNIGVMRDGLLWRWREYYDNRRSAQTREQTVFGRVTTRRHG